MSTVRIYRPAKTAMQSGRGGTRKWILEFEPGAPPVADPLMGWIGGGDPKNQVRLSFDSREAAIAFAERNGLRYHIHEPKTRRIRPKNYAANFSFNRVA